MNILTPTREIHAIISESKEIVAEKKVMGNTDDLLYHLTHNVNNFKNVNGRINSGYNENGLLIAVSVSPYSKTFIQNIERGILPVVKALLKKRYLTYSSCEGHCIYSRRFVGVAFSSEKDRDNFVCAFTPLKYWGITVKCFDRVCNSYFSMSKDGTRVVKERLTEETAEYISQDGRFLSKKQKEIETFNVLFHRNYTQYFFCELIILDEAMIEKYKGLSKIKCIGLWCYKAIGWDYITQKVVKVIEGKSFNKYRY